VDHTLSHNLIIRRYFLFGGKLRERA
jgi:hypothetical protein